MHHPNLPAYDAILRLPFGAVGLRTNQTAITWIEFLDQEAKPQKPKTAIAAAAASALRSYIENPKTELMLPLDVSGTEFQQRVWLALRAIPSGETLTYSELAEQLGTGARAVGNACRQNPTPLFVPCHRVVAKNGLGGFSGDRHGGWTQIKAWLLHHEQH